MSSGGHLSQAFCLKAWWGRYENFWVTFDKKDSASLLKDEKRYNAFYPTNRNPINLIKNTLLAIKIIGKERPQVIFSTGAGVAVPFFYVGKLFGCRTIYLEVYDRFDSPTLTGKLVYPVTDKFLVQWDEMKAFYPKAENWGQVL
jgi:UDP-N-acetylglucosamine:LPS N-acetylglucosamine transferase